MEEFCIYAVAVEVDGDFECADFVKQSEAQQILEASSITCGDFFGVGEAILMNDDVRAPATAPPQPTVGNSGGNQTVTVTTEGVEQSDWMDTGRPFLWVWVLIAAVGLLLWCCLPCFLILCIRLWLTPKKAQLVTIGTNTGPERRGSRYSNEVFCTNDVDIDLDPDTIEDPSWAGGGALGDSYSTQGSHAGPVAVQSSFARPNSVQSSFSLSIPAQGSFIGPGSSFIIPRGEPHPGPPGLGQHPGGRWLCTADPPSKNAHIQSTSYVRSQSVMEVARPRSVREGARSQSVMEGARPRSGMESARSEPMTDVPEQDEHKHDVSERSTPGNSPHTVVHFADKSYSELPVQAHVPEEGMEGCPFTLVTKPSQAARAPATMEPSGNLAKICGPLYSHLHEPALEDANAKNGGGGMPQQMSVCLYRYLQEPAAEDAVAKIDLGGEPHKMSESIYRYLQEPATEGAGEENGRGREPQETSEPLYSHLQEPAAQEGVGETGGVGESKKALAQLGSATECDGPSTRQPGLMLPPVVQPKQNKTSLMRAARSFRTAFRGHQTSISTEQAGGSFPRKVLRSLSASASQGRPAYWRRTGSSKTSQVQPDPASTTSAKASRSPTSSTSSFSSTSAGKSCLKSQPAIWLKMGSTKSSQVQFDPASTAPSEVAPSNTTSNTSSYSSNFADDSCPRTGGSSRPNRSLDLVAAPHQARASMANGKNALPALRPVPTGHQGFHMAGGARRAASWTMPTVAGSPHPGPTIFGAGSFSAPRGRRDLPAGAKSDLAAGAGGDPDAAGAGPSPRQCWKSASQNKMCMPKEEDKEDKSRDSLARPVPLPAGLDTSAEHLLPVKLFAPASATNTRPPEIIPGTPEQTEPAGQAREQLFHKRRFSQLAATPSDATITFGPGQGHPRQPSQRAKSFTYGTLGKGFKG
ncbi:hypothetical protein DUNSADRAFT_15870 [Dunaliella salina]|uniref:Transmembrane protein n=1 Tax=Dunaliella salina TaxID=3046 RepID=A0ABQ7G4Q2_DUNSA|nr:hypothetical protein DUNSADRAFT_15870 [Dunaliella salina]|eukprot:KAF5829588.1 hypothetical protein DUNSADRAFT_15870 [Dunaliella salina]